MIFRFFGKWVSFCVCGFVLGMLPVDTQAASYHVIVCGSGGGEPYVERFEEWGQRLQKVLSAQKKHGSDTVTLLTESGNNADGISTLDALKKEFRALNQKVSKNDDVFVYLIGHGSYRRNVAKLNIPGEDVSADHFQEWFLRFSAKRIVLINGASTSAPFVNTLSGRGRIICTSTRSVEERNATRFMEFFIQALEDGSADQNRDERISVLEICRQASALTEAWYQGEGYLATEHALLDDNGDGKGTRLVDMSEVLGDGKRADQCILLNTGVFVSAPLALVDAYQEAIDSVQVLIQQKTSLDSVVYYEQLETRLLEAARINRQIRADQHP